MDPNIVLTLTHLSLCVRLGLEISKRPRLIASPRVLNAAIKPVGATATSTRFGMVILWHEVSSLQLLAASSTMI